MKNLPYLSICLLLFLLQVLAGCSPVQHRIIVRNQSAEEASILVTGASPEEFPAKDTVVLPMEPGFRSLKGAGNPDTLNSSVYGVMANDSFAINVPPHSMVELTPMIRYYAAFTGKTIVLRQAGMEHRVYTDYPWKTRKSFKKGLKKSAPALQLKPAGSFLYCDLADSNRPD